MIKKGSIVKYKQPGTENEGYYRITSINRVWCNLGAVFGGKVYHKRIPRHEVTEAEAEWYKGWTESEAYKSM